MKVRISIGELKRDLSGVINQAAYGKERIVIVSRGKPKAAMIGMEDLERLQRINSYDREAQIAWLARADALRERTRRWQAAHGIEPQDSAETLRQLREERVDAYYLALAEMERCEFWTADERLYNSVKDGFPLIHWLGERGKVP